MDSHTYRGGRLFDVAYLMRGNVKCNGFIGTYYEIVEPQAKENV